MSDMCHLGWGMDGEAWRWRRRLFAWEEGLLGDLMLLLQNVNLQVDTVDRWRWALESTRTFSVRSAYKFLTLQPPVVSSADALSLWHKDVPLKVVLFGWRLIRDRLPTKDNLFRRGVIDQASRQCVSGCGSRKHHLIYSCIVICLVLYGSSFIDGSACSWLHLSRCWITLLSLAGAVVTQRATDLFSRLYGLRQIGKYGRKETTCFLMSKNARFIRWSTRLSRLPLCG